MKSIFLIGSSCRVFTKGANSATRLIGDVRMQHFRMWIVICYCVFEDNNNNLYKKINS